MSKYRVVMLLVAFAVGTTAAYGQASRTWVSGVGDDANPCSRTAPCKTFAGAISKTAVGGEIDALDPGGFGAVTITKAITLDGGGGQVASVLVTGTSGIIVAAPAGAVVILRNLRINGISGGINGIQFNSGKALIIENCNIFGFTQRGISIQTSAASQVFVTGTSSNNNSDSGLKSINTGATTQVTIANSNFLGNGTFGIFAGDFTDMSVFHSTASGSVIGVIAQAAAGTATGRVSETTVANNTIGMQAGGAGAASLLQLGHNYIFGSATGLLAGANGTINTGGENLNTGAGAPTGAGSIQIQ